MVPFIETGPASTTTPPFPFAKAPEPYQQLLGDTAQLLLQDNDPDTLCQTIFEALRGPLKLDVYFHYLVSKSGKHLELASSGGNEVVRAALGSRLAFGEAVCGTVAQNCTGMVVTSVQQRMDAMTSLIRSFGIRCYTCNPLIVRGAVVGTFSFGSSQRDNFNEAELELLKLVVQQVTIATERRIQNDHIRELERLAAIGRFSATLAHEINNPLESLSTILYLLRDQVVSEDATELLQQAEEQVQRLAETSHRTLDLFRGNKQTPGKVHLSQLARDLAADIRLPHHARLDSRIEDGLYVTATPGELRQVLFNLLINAAQFSPAGKPVVLDVRRAGNKAEARIKDEGPGITAEARAQLFQPFYTTRSEGGTGVGLWVSREMIERAGGTLTFESNPVERPGAEFIATLPLLN